MSTASIHLNARLPTRRTIARELPARDFAGNDDTMRLPARLPAMDAAAMQAETSANGAAGEGIPSPASTDLNGLSARMRLVLQSAGGASAVARRCGFSASVVRNWCHGRSDISRERCVIVARALGISLRWLVAGEGSMRDEDDPDLHPPMPQAAPPGLGEPSIDGEAYVPAIDSGLLAAAYRVLQSYIGLVGGSLGPMQRADALVQLYHVLGHTNCPGHAERMVAFHSTLGGYFCRKKSLLG